MIRHLGHPLLEWSSQVVESTCYLYMRGEYLFSYTSSRGLEDSQPDDIMITTDGVLRQ